MEGGDRQHKTQLVKGTEYRKDVIRTTWFEVESRTKLHSDNGQTDFGSLDRVQSGPLSNRAD